MDENLKTFEPLIDRMEIYGKTSIELFRLKSLNSAAHLVSIMVTRVLLISIAMLFVLSLSMAAAIYLGDFLGKLYQGFLWVAGFYLVAIVVLIICMPNLGMRSKNYFIRILLM
ncbi:MAG: hypothetical protein CFE21_14010 [Bacteroidetes bacterium B1(2017)]|nr:MAG: hypothetical protein CFE21_14010 [Bacteroidetes bacterium B1(2017)]